MTRFEGGDPDDTSLVVTTAEGAGWAIVRVDGEIDVSTAATLDDKLKAAMASSDRVIIDLSGVRFMDSTGLAVLMRAQKKQENAATGLRLAGPPDRVVRLFTVTKLDDVFSVYPSVEAAQAEEFGGSAS